MSVYQDILRVLRNGTVVTAPAVEVHQTKLLVAAAAHAAEDVLSESASTGAAQPWFWSGMARRKGGRGTITRAIALNTTTALTPRITVYLYQNLPRCNLLDNVANTGVINADRFHYVGRIDFPAMEDLGGMSEAIVTPSTSGNLPLRFQCSDGLDGLFGVSVTRDAVTFTALDGLLIKFFCEQD